MTSGQDLAIGSSAPNHTYDEVNEARVEAYEEGGLTRSDAQGVVHAEVSNHGAFWLLSLEDLADGVQ